MRLIMADNIDMSSKICLICQLLSDCIVLNVIHLWDDGKTLLPILAKLYQLLLIQAFRPDRVIATSAVFVSTVMSSEALSLGSQLLR